MHSITVRVAFTTVADGGRFDEMPKESGKKSDTDATKSLAKEGELTGRP